MKKTLAFLMALILLVSAIPLAMAEEADITSWILADDPASIEGTVRFYIPFKGSQGMDAMIADFNQTYPNIKIELNTYSNGGDGNLAVNTAMMSGDVDVLASFNFPNTMKRWENGLYMDLGEYIEKYNIDIAANWGTDRYKYNDTYYTFPCGALSTYIVINMTDWEKAGLGELPTEWTWDEYLAASAAMTQRDENGNTVVYGGSNYQSAWTIGETWYQVYGHDMFYGEDGLSNFTHPLMVNALTREMKAEYEDKIWFPITTYKADGIQTQNTFLTHKTASSITCNMVRFIRDTENYPVDWVTAFAPWPVEEKGQVNYMAGVPHWSHAGIAANCQDKEAAWYWLAWYSTYGSRYLALAGHQSAWKGTDQSGVVSLIFGSEEEARS